MSVFSRHKVEHIDEPDDPSKIPSSATAGVVPMSIEGPLKDERFRLAVGMTDEDRAFRKQWLQDQILAESEPVEIPGYYEARYNPIRRATMWPLNQVFKPLEPILGPDRHFFYRYITGRGLMAAWFALGTIYLFKYNTHSWTSPSGWKVYESKSRVLPGDPGYGEPYKAKPQDYADFGFKESPI